MGAGRGPSFMKSGGPLRAVPVAAFGAVGSVFGPAARPPLVVSGLGASGSVFVPVTPLALSVLGPATPLVVSVLGASRSVFGAPASVLGPSAGSGFTEALRTFPHLGQETSWKACSG